MKKLRLNKLSKLPEKKLAVIKGGSVDKICYGCLCSAIDTSCINEDGLYAAQK